MRITPLTQHQTFGGALNPGQTARTIGAKFAAAAATMTPTSAPKATGAADLAKAADSFMLSKTPKAPTTYAETRAAAAAAADDTGYSSFGFFWSDGFPIT